MKKINVILGNHNHQPVGNFGFVMEGSYTNAYKPFLDALTLRDLRFTFHYSGPLLDWLDAEHPEHLDALQALAREGRIEMIGGGYYEPVLPAIPERDKIGQMRLMSDYLRKRFSYDPKGAWIAERVWEPHLVRPIAEAGLSYIVIDDAHFKSVGLQDHELLGYYTTDEEDARVSVFPISQDLRYLIPFRPVEKIIEYLAGMATEEGDRLLVLHDDGEKYGDWPGTYDWVYKEGWLAKFFDALQAESSWITLTTYSDYMAEYPPIGRVYLPTASYEEMMEWVLPVAPQRTLHKVKTDLDREGRKDALTFLKGSYWRNFAVKYSEVNTMLKRMQYASRLVDTMEGEARAKAKKHLYMGECNCPYWHGTFGGVYLNHLRYANYSNLIIATALYEKEAYGDDFLRVTKEDFDLDGKDEVIVSTPTHSLFFHGTGGRILEWDYKPSPINLVDTLRRREEAYHDVIFNKDASSAHKHGEEEEGGTLSIHEVEKYYDDDIEDFLIFDRNEKSLFVDHFLQHPVTAGEFMRLAFEEKGTFATSDYRVSEKKDGGNALVTYECDGAVSGAPLRVIKEYTCPKEGGTILLRYTFLNTGDAPLQTTFATECNFTLLAPDADDRYYFTKHGTSRVRVEGDWKMNSVGEFEGTLIGAVDEGYKKIAISFATSEPVRFLRMPVITVSDAVDHFEKVYQNSTIVIMKEMSLPAKGSASFGITLTVEGI